MNTQRLYILTLKSDQGKHKLKVQADNEEQAIDKACKAENAPRCAIISVKVVAGFISTPNKSAKIQQRR